MASKLRVRISDNNRYVTNKDDVSYAPCRLYLKRDSKTGKDYYEGALELMGGELLWISTGGMLKVNTNNKGNEYLTVQAKVTKGKGSGKVYV